MSQETHTNTESGTHASSLERLVSLCDKWECIASQHSGFAKEYELIGEPSFLSEAHWHKSNTLKLCARQLRDLILANAKVSHAANE